MKKMLALGALLVGVVGLQAQGYGHYDNTMDTQMVGKSRKNYQTPEQIAKINKLFYGGKAPVKILPYLTYTNNVLQYYPNNGTQMSIWPKVRVGIDCVAGYILYDDQTRKFSCIKYPVKQQNKPKSKMRSMGSVDYKN